MKKPLVTWALALGLLGSVLLAPPAMAADSTVTTSPAASPAQAVPGTTPTPTPSRTPAPSPVPTAAPTASPAPPAGQKPAPGANTSRPVPTAAPRPAPSQAPAPAPAPAPVQAAPTTAAPTPSPTATPTQTPEKIVVTGAIKVRWDALGGAAGPLGAPLSNEKAGAGYTGQAFKGGFIYTATATGTHHVLTAAGIGKAWAAGGGAARYGIPVTDDLTAAGTTYQKFSGGNWIFRTGLAVNTKGAVGAKWLADGALNGPGAPTTAEKCGLRDGGCYQAFTKATILHSAATGARSVHGGILSRYQASGLMAGALGYPKGAETCTLPQRGCFQDFQHGQILWTAAVGAYSLLNSPIRSHFAGQGGVGGFLMFPRGEQVCGQSDGGCYQNFQGGVAYNAKATGAHSVRNGKFLAGYQRRGWHNGILGFPSAQQVCGLPNGGCYQDFRNGRLWSNNAHDSAYMTRGGIGGSYLAKGGPRSFLGYPISDEHCAGGQCVQTFVGGYIGWGASGAGGSYVMSECQKLNNGGSRYTSGGANRVLLAFTSGYNQSYATIIYCKRIAGIYVTDWRTDGYVGTSGFKPPGVPSGPTRYLFSPTGSFTFTEAFGLGNPGTKLTYRTLNPRSRWGGNPWTATYNRYHESSSWVGYDENMWYFATRPQHDYRQGAVINYNRPNIVQNAGFAIFLHENKVPTAGCVSVDDWAMVDFLHKATPGDRIIMGVRGALFR